MVTQSELEELFAFQVKAAGLPEPEREAAVIPGRKFRFDFCFREARLLIEINGGTFTKGGHSSGLGLRRDYEKLRLAQDHGWKVYPFDAQAVRSGEAVEQVRKALEGD